LCEKCSFKIHNKGKRAKHALDTSIIRNLMVRKIMVVGGGKLSNYIRNTAEDSKCIEEGF
jgi:hypothetical protein